MGIPGLLQGRHTFKVGLILDNGVSLFSNPIELHVSNQHGLQCLPNPGDGIIQIKLPLAVTGIADEMDMEILDFSGKPVKRLKTKTDLPSADISTFPRGLYIISCYAEGQIFSGKFMKI